MKRYTTFIVWLLVVIMLGGSLLPTHDGSGLSESGNGNHVAGLTCAVVSVSFVLCEQAQNRYRVPGCVLLTTGFGEESKKSSSCPYLEISFQNQLFNTDVAPTLFSLDCMLQI